jgi:CheY-like chemotaxis protein
MSQEVKERIFEPFFTTKEEGQGLGSSIVYGIVRRHGGEITVQSEPGGGTCFTVALPSLKETDRPNLVVAKTAPVEEDRTPQRKHVLVVDDDELNMDAHRTILAEAGYIVRGVTNGRDAIALFEKEPIDIVVTDLGMPGMCGWDVATAVKSLNPRAGVILVSGWGVQEDEEKARESGVDLILPKPCPADDLVGAVKKIDRAQEGGDRVAALPTADSERHQSPR